MIQTLGIPKEVTLTLIGVFVVSFAATTLDTATRLQRYVVADFGRAVGIRALTRKHPATLVAVGTAFALAFYNGTGKGALTLWPLFGCVNQLLAGLALLVVTVWLARRGTPTRYTVIPMLFMLVMTGWAILVKLGGFWREENWLLFGIALAVVVLEIWMIVETAIVLRSARAPDATASVPPAGP